MTTIQVSSSTKQILELIKKKENKNFEESLRFILNTAKIIHLLTARKEKSILVTCDEDFRNFNNIIIV